MPSASLSSCRTLTTCAICLNGLVKPRLGMRRMRGICPPSNPGRVEPPERAVWPLPPRPAVFPMPDPGPRPLRMRARWEPRGGFRLCSVTRAGAAVLADPSLATFGLAARFALAWGFAFGFRPPFPFPFSFTIRLLPSLGRCHHEEGTHLIEHAAQRRVVRFDHLILMVLQADRPEGAPLRGRTPDPRAHLADAELLLARRRHRPVATGFALAVFPCGGISTHGRPPGAACSGSL